MDIANPAQGIVDKNNITPSTVSAKSESRRGALDGRRKPQNDGVVSVADRMRLEPARMVLQFIVRLDIIRLVLANNIRRVFFGQSLDFFSCRLGVRVQDANDVRNVFVGEARVLLPYASRIEDILGRWKTEEEVKLSAKDVLPTRTRNRSPINSGQPYLV